MNQDNLDSGCSTRRIDPIWIYTDGTAVVQAECIGAYAAVVMFPDKTFELVAGSALWTKVNRMELTAVNSALYYLWAFRFNKGRRIAGEEAPGIPAIHIFTDSQYVERGVLGINARNENRDIWACFDELAQNFEISAQHYGRNIEPAQNQCDAACHGMRLLFKEWLCWFKAQPSYSTFEMTRKTSIMSLPLAFPKHHITT